MRSERAMVFTAPGQLELRDLPAVDAGSEGTIVRVRCCTVCESDRRSFSGGRPAPTPSVLGHEIVGTVLRTRPGATLCDGRALTPGMRVVWPLVASCGDCRPCRAGLTAKCHTRFKYGHEALARNAVPTGGFASLVRLDPRTVPIRVPDTLDDRLAAVATCAGATAHACLRHARIRQEDRVVVFGAGMLGLCAVRFLVHSGVHVTVVEPQAQRRELAQAAGAQQVQGTGADLDARAFDVALEMSGAQAAHEAALKSLDDGGRLVLAGAVGPVPGLTFDPEDWVRRCLTVTGAHNYEPADLVATLALFALGVHPPDTVFGPSIDLADLARALAAGEPHVRVPVHPGAP